MTDSEKRPLIVLTGPTAAGKTELSIQLAKAMNGEIISADSMQVYRGMDIGSAKITKEEMQGVRHHLIDVLDPEEAFHVVMFQELAKQAMQEIRGRNRIPILTGGTGFYIQAILNDIDFTQEETDRSYRRQLEEIASGEDGVHRLYAMLSQVDPKSCESIHENNVKRVIRALEYYHQTGEPISSHNEREHQRVSPYNYVYFVLYDDRAVLYDRIDRRVDSMMQKGLLEEVRKLKEAGLHRECVSMQGLGYKEMLDYLDGKITLEEAVYRIKRDSRHFAKRQLTWFRREKDVIWVNRSEFPSEKQILDYMIDVCRKKGIENLL